jgi:hypothetical protein
MDGNGATLTIDPNAILDSEIDSAPMRMICTMEQLPFPETSTVTPQEVFAGLPAGQTVRHLVFDASHDKLADRYKAKGCSLRNGAITLSGHDAVVEHCGFRNFGALKNGVPGAEAFVVSICGAMGAPDRNKIAQLPQSYTFRPARINENQFWDYNPSLSDDQVSVFMIVGNTGEPGGWNSGNWVQHFRDDAILYGNRVVASGQNLVQGGTIYQCLKGTVTKNVTEGAYLGYYGDYYGTRKLKLYENSYHGAYNGIRIVLSPTSGGTDMHEQFFHSDYYIGPNDIEASDVDVFIDTLGPTTDRRYIRNMFVDQSHSLHAVGVEGLYRTKECI